MKTKYGNVVITNTGRYQITAVDIKKLEEKVKNKGLEWRKIQ